MGLYKGTHAVDVRSPLSLEGWKVAIAIGAAIFLAPVVGVVLLVLVATLIPVLPLLATFFVSFWIRGRHSTLPSTPVRPPHVLRPRMSHAPAS